MFDFFKKLMLARQLKIEKGVFKILEQRTVITPAWTFSYILKEAKNYWETANLIYVGCKTSTWKGFSEGFRKKFKVKHTDLPGWLKNINELAGNGVTEIIKVDYKNYKDIIKVTDSPFVETYGKSDNPIDHALRGYFAGGASAAFRVDVDCIETQCQSMGHKFCEFITMRKSDLLKFIKKSKETRVEKSALRRQIGEIK